jgi:hypothetical protein
MKQLTTLAAALTLSIGASAAVHTVNNNVSGGAQFSNLQIAINAAANGDTILVQGSPNSYSDVTINDKKIILLGPGYAPLKDNPLTATISSITYLDSTSTVSSCSGSEVHGFIISQVIFGSPAVYDGIKIIRNRVANIHMSNNESDFYNCIIQSNYITGILNANSDVRLENMVIRNNVFNSGAYFNTFNNTSNVLIDHNLFFGTQQTLFSGTCRFLTISNNVIVKRSLSNGASFSTFLNNITFNCTDNEPWLTNNNIDGNGNVVNTDPQMVDQTNVNNNSVTPLMDFTIATGPANNSGSDGKDMGLLYDATGSLNWTATRTSRIPFIYSMNIANPTVTPGGNLSVTVTANAGN